MTSGWRRSLFTGVLALVRLTALFLVGAVVQLPVQAEGVGYLRLNEANGQYQLRLLFPAEYAEYIQVGTELHLQLDDEFVPIRPVAFVIHGLRSSADVALLLDHDGYASAEPVVLAVAPLPEINGVPLDVQANQTTRFAAMIEAGRASFWRILFSEQFG